MGSPPGSNTCPWEQWRATVSEDEAQQTWEHIARSPNCSIDKARRLIEYQPRYSSLQAVQEAVTWLIAQRAGESQRLTRVVFRRTGGGEFCPMTPLRTCLEHVMNFQTFNPSTLLAPP